MIKDCLVGESMKNSGLNDDHFISSGQFWKEEDEKTMTTSVSCLQEKEEDDDGGSVWTPRSRNGEKRDEGLSKTMMITRPKGGNRYLCMDSEEMKACKDLGFELEVDNIKFEFDTTMRPRRISNPGDDPRDVKARLKLWAQAVAQASSPRRVRG